MSAFSIGTAAYRSDRVKADITEISDGSASFGVSALEDIELPSRDDAFAEIVKWVPGEVIAGYAAVIAAAGAGVASAVAWLFVGVAGAWIFLAGATEWFKLGKGVRFRWGQSVIRVVLGSLAFLLWSFAIPGSPSRAWSFVADVNDATLSVAVILAATLFGMIAALVVGLLDRYRPTW